MYQYLKSICLFLFCLLPLTIFAHEYQTRMHIPDEQQQWFTQLMQGDILIPGIYPGMPLGIIEGPTFENGVFVLFMIIKSEEPYPYIPTLHNPNILAVPTFKDGQAYGRGIDMDDSEGFWLYKGNYLIFDVEEEDTGIKDTYKILID